MESKSYNRNTKNQNSSGEKKKSKKKKKSKRNREKSEDLIKGKLSSESATPTEPDDRPTDHQQEKILDTHFDRLRQSLNNRQAFLLSSGYSPSIGPNATQNRTASVESHTNGTNNSQMNNNKLYSDGLRDSSVITQSISRLGLSNGGLPKINESSTSNRPTGNSQLHSNDSLRWENALNDPEQERQRILVYKMNRRKRYLAQSQKQNGANVRKSNSRSNVGSMENSSGLAFTLEPGCSMDSVMADVLPAVNAVVKVHPQLVF